MKLRPVARFPKQRGFLLWPARLAPSGGGGPTAGGVITRVERGAVVTASAGATSISPAFPTTTTIAAGEKLLLVHVLRAGTMGVDAVEDPSNPGGIWTRLVSHAPTGLGNLGADTGPARITIWHATAAGGETGTVSLTWPTGAASASAAFIVRYSGANAGWQALQYAIATDSTGGTSWSVTGGTALTLLTNDMVLCISGTQLADGGAFSEAFSATGITFATASQLAETAINGGMRGHLHAGEAAVTTGSGTPQAPTFTFTWSEGAPTGPSVFIVLRNN